MTRPTASYDLAGREIPPSADAGTNGNHKSVPHRSITDPGEPDELHLTRADIAHYDLRLAELSTPSASHGRSIRLCAGAGRDSVQGSHDGRHGGGGSPSGDVPAEPERDARRPNAAPAYYLGHPAALWITAMRPHRRPTVPRYPMRVAVSGGNPIPGSGVLQYG